MKISALKANPENPRTITPAKSAQLKKAMVEFGDLGGIVFNVKSGQLVGGLRRSENFDPATAVVYTKKYSKPTRTGTVAEGYVLLKGERFSYREVRWPKAKEMAANIAANKNAGEWNEPSLAKWLKELGSFDIGIDLDLTMFDADEIAELPGITDVSGHTRVGGAGQDDDEDDTPRALKVATGQLWELGTTQLRCGPEELEFCDKLISRYEKWSGQDARLLSSAKKKTA